MTTLTRSAAMNLVAALILSTASAAVGAAVPPALAQEAPIGSLPQLLSVAVESVDAALAAVEASDVATGRLQYGAYDDAWDALENGVRDPHPDVYDSIERAMDLVNDVLLKADNPDPVVAAAALRMLRQTIVAEALLLG